MVNSKWSGKNSGSHLPSNVVAVMHFLNVTNSNKVNGLTETIYDVFRNTAKVKCGTKYCARIEPTIVSKSLSVARVFFFQKEAHEKNEGAAL